LSVTVREPSQGRAANRLYRSLIHGLGGEEIVSSNDESKERVGD